MKKQILFFSVLGSAVAAQAQISLTQANMPVNNTTFYFYDANVPSPAFNFNKTGITNTWDFTTISPVPGAEDTSFVRLPSTVSGGSSFPTATYADWEAGEKTTGFIKVDATGASYLGMYGDVFNTGNNVALIFPQPAQTVTFPFTYGQSKNLSNNIEYKAAGAAMGQPTIDSVWMKVTNYYNSEVIAAGNMIVPAGTFPALLQVKRTSSIDTLWIKSSATANQWAMAPGFPKVHPVDSTYSWYTNDVFYQYAHVIYKNGVVTDVNYYRAKTVSPVSGISNPQANQVEIWPNPASNRLQLSTGNTKLTSVKITNITGQEMPVAYNGPNDIDISGLQQGLYLVHITTENNSAKVLKLIKQ